MKHMFESDSSDDSSSSNVPRRFLDWNKKKLKSVSKESFLGARNVKISKLEKKNITKLKQVATVKKNMNSDKGKKTVEEALQMFTTVNKVKKQPLKVLPEYEALKEFKKEYW